MHIARLEENGSGLLVYAAYQPDAGLREMLAEAGNTSGLSLSPSRPLHYMTAYKGDILPVGSWLAGASQSMSYGM